MSATRTIEGEPVASIQADILEHRAERVSDLIEDLLGALGDDESTPWPPSRKRRKPDVQQAITEGRRIRDTLTVKYLTGEEAFTEATDGVCLLGDDLDEALLLGHVDRGEAARRAATACADLCGNPLDDHPVEDWDVLHEWGVFEDCSWDDYSDWSWWFHRARDDHGLHTVAVTRVRIT